MTVETIIKHAWEKYNGDGVITYRSDTLSKRTLAHSSIDLYLVHNASRDTYDKAPKQIAQPVSNSCPFCDDSNPELFRTPDGKLRIFGNRFACLQYQSILASLSHQEEVSVEFLLDSLIFAHQHPELTLLYNAKNAGKTVSHLFWLLSFQRYENLVHPAYASVPLQSIEGLMIRTKARPTYMLTFEFANNITTAAKLLFELISYMDHSNFNMLLYQNTVYFIPREPIEIPSGFDKHRFGGLEMIGSFVMKSKEALEEADPEFLVAGMQEIEYKPSNRKKLESFLSALN